MAEDDLHQPNDRLFRTTFGTPENSAALLKATLPGPVAALVEWSKLQRLPGSFVDSAFRASHTDLLFSAPMAGRDALIYVLLEHQSTRDRLLPLRLLRYMVRIWEQVAGDQDLILKVPLSVFQRLLRYMLAADVDRAGFRTRILQLPESETRSIAMTLAESLRQEGRQEGRQEALQDAVLSVLLTRFESIPDGIRAAVRSVHAEDPLQSLHRAAIECPSLEAFAERCA